MVMVESSKEEPNEERHETKRNFDGYVDREGESMGKAE
jgi:hypothetical protein